uniref:Uncharacterized protein n=1 Tax=Podoviridae sp. ctsNK10 TaxID=2826582 RepID=A0A8S5NM16_9CAUD|nr:MAG TPA: hypothetical protein [Podoviridae sp. ctsNK10]
MTLDEVKQHIPEDVKDIVETKIAAETKSYENRCHDVRRG